jgi:DNA-binding LacI/PurR family transcriptional regulator
VAGGRERAPDRPAPARRQPTLETVAAVSGYSRATVSRVVNGSAGVAPEIRRAVEEAIDQIGYVPNRAARSLVTRRTDSIALVVREPVDFGLADPYLSSLIIAASQSLVGTGVQLAVMMASNDEEHAQLGNFVLGGHVDGAILVSVHDDDPLPRRLARAGVPVVVGGRPASPTPDVGFVDVDNLGGARLAAEHLLTHGRRQLAMVTGPNDMTAANDRLDGFRAALREAGHPVPTVAYGTFTLESGEAGTREILRRLPEVDAIFAANDMMAAGALRALRETGRAVPDDVAVIGFDDVPLALHTDPPLTTIHQPLAQQARQMVEMVLARLRGQVVDTAVVLPARVVVRGSA